MPARSMVGHFPILIAAAAFVFGESINAHRPRKHGRPTPSFRILEYGAFQDRWGDFHDFLRSLEGACAVVAGGGWAMP